MFIDQIKIFALAGDGGKGAVAFHREAFVPKGGPSGGNGGRGGDVILQADHDLNNLIAQYYNPRLIAQKGEGGKGKGMDGHAGNDKLVRVPCGTLVWQLPDDPKTMPARGEDEEAETPPPQLAVSGSKRPVIRYQGKEKAVEVNLTDEPEGASAPHLSAEGRVLVADLTEHGQKFIVCKGGRGGLGNRNFATSRNQTPRFAQPGEPGDFGSYLLELRIMADVGLVGYPNAGKSTLLAAISAARPKIAPYPFTTLHPQIGIVEYVDFHRLTVCDVPGLIEGAHNNVGLGHAFLRHIQRCKVLVIIVDMAGTDGRPPWDDYEKILSELRLYDESLVSRRRLVAGNKMDEPAAAENLKRFKRKVPRTPVLTMSAGYGENVEEFKAAIRKAVQATLPKKRK